MHKYAIITVPTGVPCIVYTVTPQEFGEFLKTYGNVVDAELLEVPYLLDEPYVAVESGAVGLRLAGESLLMIFEILGRGEVQAGTPAIKDHMYLPKDAISLVQKSLAEGWEIRGIANYETYTLVFFLIKGNEVKLIGMTRDYYIS